MGVAGAEHNVTPASSPSGSRPAAKASALRLQTLRQLEEAEDRSALLGGNVTSAAARRAGLGQYLAWDQSLSLASWAVGVEIDAFHQRFRARKQYWISVS